MPRKIKQLTRAATGLSFGSSGASSVITDVEPYWSDPYYGGSDTFTVTPGQPFSFTLTATDPDPGDTINIVEMRDTGGIATVQAQSGNTRQVLINAPSGLAAGTYYIELDLNPTTDAETDWINRSQGAGVVWAHNFEHENEVLNFLLAPGGGYNDPARTWDASHYPTDISHDSSEGFAGGGCLKIHVPSADEAFERGVGIPDTALLSLGTVYTDMQAAFGVQYPGAPYGRGGWKRPYAPLATVGNDRTTGSGRGVSDPAASGSLTLRSWSPWTNAYQDAQFKHGLYSHADYALPSGWTRDGDEFWLQFRMKVPANRFYSDRMIPAYTGGTGSRWFTNGSPYRARQADGKYHWIGTLSGGLNSQTQELVLYGVPKISTSEGDGYNTTTAWAKTYTAFGPEIFRTQSGAWEIPADVWVTYLYHIKAGHAYAEVSDTGGDNVIEMFASVNGSAYVTLGSVTTQKLMYAGGNVPYGWNAFEPTHYCNSDLALINNGLAACRDPTVSGPNAFSTRLLNQDSYDVKYTQIIFSRDWIAPPAAGA